MEIPLAQIREARWRARWYRCGSSQQLSKKAFFHWPSHLDGRARVLEFKANTGGLSMHSSAEHLRMQRDESRLKSHGFLIVQPNPFVDEVSIEAVPKAMFAMEAPGPEHSWMTWAVKDLL